jgi:hypothetical protein
MLGHDSHDCIWLDAHITTSTAVGPYLLIIDRLLVNILEYACSALDMREGNVLSLGGTYACSRGSSPCCGAKR